MVSHVMITTIQWLAHVKRGHVTTCLQWDIMDLFYKFIKDNVKGTGLFSHRRGLSSPPLHLFPFWYSPVEILATQSSIQISKWGSPMKFAKYQSVPNGSGMRSESKAVPELLNPSPHLFSLLLHLDLACLCVTGWRWNHGVWTLYELFSLAQFPS